MMASSGGQQIENLAWIRDGFGFKMRGDQIGGEGAKQGMYRSRAQRQVSTGGGKEMEHADQWRGDYFGLNLDWMGKETWIQWRIWWRERKGMNRQSTCFSNRIFSRKQS
jgi:hypothetical protein